MEVSAGLSAISSHIQHSLWGQVLTRLQRMRRRWRPEPIQQSTSSLYDSIRPLLSGERGSILRSQLHWFRVDVENEKAAGDPAGAAENHWSVGDDGKRHLALEFRHKSNVPSEHENFDRPALENLISTFDSQAGQAAWGRSTGDMKRIADYHTYTSTYMARSAEPDKKADEEIREQLLRAQTRRIGMSKSDTSEELPADAEIKSVSGDQAKFILMIKDDEIAKEAALIADAIGAAVQADMPLVPAP